MKWLNKIFSKKNSQEEPLEVQLRKEIMKCENIIFKYQQDIHKIRNWSIDLIHNTFVVPKNLWYEELENIKIIINIEKNKNVSKTKKIDTLKIALSYKQQLELRKYKIEAYKQNIKELKQMIVDQEILKQKISEAEQKNTQIEKHKKNAKILQKDGISQELIQHEKINSLKDNISKLKENLNYKQEVNNQLEILYHKYGESTDFETTAIYLEELEKLIEKK